MLSLSLLFRRRLPSLRRRRLSTAATPSPSSESSTSSPPSLSARLSFVFDQLDALDRDRSAAAKEKDAALHRLRSWHHNQNKQQQQEHQQQNQLSHQSEENETETLTMREALRREVELVHPWPEWIELMDRLAQQKYFDAGRIEKTEEVVAEAAGIDLSAVREETGFDFSRDWTTVRTGFMNFGRDRFDILRSLSKKDIQILVGNGCPSMDPKVVFSAKLLRKYVHLDEGDVCSACSLRNTCSRGYILTRKEDEARTLDMMRVLLTFGFDHIKGTVENEPLTKMKSVKAVVRKLLHEVVKLSAVPIDPNLPPPVIKKPPPKVKQPPPPPKKRIGRDDVEMKKGDWLCPKCDFMNFAKNTVCLQCDAKRPKRQLLPGEWECPKCNFLNYRRNMACFHCEHKRPPDEFSENGRQEMGYRQHRSPTGTRLPGVSDAWNFDFDDNESDGADVAAFEFADPPKGGDGYSSDSMLHAGTHREFEDGIHAAQGTPRKFERSRSFSGRDEQPNSLHSPRSGFNDFDDEEDDLDSYEIESNNSPMGEIPRRNFSEVEKTSESEDFDDFKRHQNSTRGLKDILSGLEDDVIYSSPEDDFADSDRRAQGREAINSHRRMPSDYDTELSESDSEFGGSFTSTMRRTGQKDGGRNSIRHGSTLHSDNELGSEPDDDLHFAGSRSRGNKDISARRSNSFRDRGRLGSTRDRSGDRVLSRRNRSSDSDDDNFSHKASGRSNRGSRRDEYGGSRGDDRFRDFDGRRSARRDQFNAETRHSSRNERGSRGNGHGRWKGDDGKSRVMRNESGSRGNGYGGWRGDDGKSRVMRNERGSRGNGYGGWRGDDGNSRVMRNESGGRGNGYGRNREDGDGGFGRRSRFSDRGR